jgi:anti-anti-sigma factor
VAELCSIDFDEEGAYVVARLSGEIDISNAETVGERLAERFNVAEHYVIDLSTTTHLDSAAIRLFFVIGERLRTRRQAFTLVIPESAPIRRVLTIANVSAVIDVLPDLDDVIARDRSGSLGSGHDGSRT